jgi:predicted nucleic acid-binding protein
MALIAADTTFLIDLSREIGRRSGPVHDFLREYAADQFAVPLIVLGEFAAGFADISDPLYMSVKSKFRLLAMDERVADSYREIFRFLKLRGLLIGANDMWIAASSIRNGASLVTRNAADFRRIPGLKVLSY